MRKAKRKMATGMLKYCRIFIFLSITQFPMIASAATFYVRDGGGNTNQCQGTTNAVYPGSGLNQPCAYDSLMYLTGYNCGNFGGSCAVGGSIASGDTVFIDGDSDVSPGTQAVYKIGQGNLAFTSCTGAGASDCTLGNLPANVTITGTGTHRPLIQPTNFPWQVLNANNNGIKLTWLEIAPHTTCGYQSPTTQCTNGEGSNRTSDGITMNGSGAVYTDVWIHGFSRFGIVTGSLSGTNTLTRVWLIGNAYGGFTLGNGDSSTNTGTLVWNQPIVEWNGCLENFPLTSGIDSPADHKNCYGQGNNGYGDGIAFGPSGSTNAGSWTIIGPGSISFNTQDGLDTLHGTGSGTIQIDKMRFEGNAGNQLKMNALTSTLTNSLVIGDCGWWFGSANAASGAMLSGDSCRALGDATLFNVSNNTVVTLYNNTILSNGNITLGSKDINFAGCNGSTAIHVKNNLILGGYAWFDDTSFNGAGGNALTTYYYNNGNDGNGSGTCGSLVWDENYNILSGGRYGSIACNGANDKCNTAPGFSAGTFPMGTAGGAANTYYQGQQGITLLPISNSSAAKGAGVNSLTFWNTSNDYYNVTRTSPPAVGGLEVASCAVNTYGCFYNSDCCGGTCSSNICGGSCTSNGGGCSINSTCCSNLCSLSTCVSCVSNGNSCSSGANCCSGFCCSNSCSATSCGSGGNTGPAYCKIGGNSNITGIW